MVANEQISATPNNLFLGEKRGFVNTGDLQVGDLVMNVDGGSGKKAIRTALHNELRKIGKKFENGIEN